MICYIAEGGDGCISHLPEDLDGLVAIWPVTPNSELDCECVIFFADLEQDLNFEHCYCLKEQLTAYNVTLTDRQLCWNNLTNDTKVVLARDIFDLKTDSFQRTFLSVIQFNVTGS